MLARAAAGVELEPGGPWGSLAPRPKPGASLNTPPSGTVPCPPRFRPAPRHRRPGARLPPPRLLPLLLLHRPLPPDLLLEHSSPGTWRARSGDRETLDLGAVCSSPMVGIGII